MRSSLLPAAQPPLQRGLFLFGIVFLVLLAGCDLFGSASSPPALHIETDRDTYHLARDTTIGVRIRNVSGDTLYYNSCIGTAVEVIGDGRVIDTVNLPTCSCLCRAALPPGQWVPPSVSNVSIRALMDISDRLRARISVSYRLAYGAFYRDKAWEHPLARRERRSNLVALRWGDAPPRQRSHR